MQLVGQEVQHQPTSIDLTVLTVAPKALPVNGLKEPSPIDGKPTRVVGTKSRPLRKPTWEQGTKSKQPGKAIGPRDVATQ